MDKKKGNVEIDLKRLFLAVARRLWLILLVGLVTALLAFGYVSSFVQETYAAEVRMYVNNTYGAGTVGFSSSQMSAAQSLASTYMVILDSYDVLEEVGQVAHDRYGASRVYKVGQLRGMIQTEALEETEVFRVVVISTNRKDAEKIANAVKDVLPETIDEIVNGSLGNDPENVNMAPPLVALQVAENRGKVAPNEEKYAILGFVVGALATTVFVAARDVMDTSINSEEYLTYTYEDIPLLAVIPDAENPKSGNGYKGYYESKKKKAPVPPNVPPAQKKGGAK